MSNVKAPELEASGLVRIIDKDGNVKSELEIVSVETRKKMDEEEKDDAAKHNGKKLNGRFDR